MAKTEIRIGGLGGQGVIMAGMILGKAASIYDSKNAAMIQSFGPEARGSACSTQVIIDDVPIGYPYAEKLDVLVTLSQEAFELFRSELKPEGVLVYEEELVKPHDLPPTVQTFGTPATRFAESMRRTMVLNIVMLGFLTAVTSVASLEAMRQAVEVSVPPGTERLNLAAFFRGYSHGLEVLGRTKKPD
jgi:2-oxoglutarate ferredoxin oxidoreductase subunit gamma